MKRIENAAKFTQKIKIIFLLVFLCVSGTSVFAQVETAPKPPPSAPRPSRVAPAPPKQNKTLVERSIAVDGKVNISLCVSAGNLKVSGWNRNEIRTFISRGSDTGFKILQADKGTQNPVWVMIVGYDATKPRPVGTEECISGGDIELDVPRGATVNVKSRTSETTIDSVGKVTVENVRGDIFLNNIERGVEAKTYEGDVTVEKSGGAMTLSSTSGNIVAHDVSPSEIGDIFKAKTGNGAITLRAVEHRQTEANSTTGSIKFLGDFLSGGRYDFGTSNGAIVVLVTEKASCRINASYGFGAFSSEVPLKDIVKNEASRAQSLTALLGNGDATLNLTTYSGAIQIRKQ